MRAGGKLVVGRRCGGVAGDAYAKAEHVAVGADRTRDWRDREGWTVSTQRADRARRCTVRGVVPGAAGLLRRAVRARVASLARAALEAIAVRTLGAELRQAAVGVGIAGVAGIAGRASIRARERVRAPGAVVPQRAAGVRAEVVRRARLARGLIRCGVPTRLARDAVGDLVGAAFGRYCGACTASGAALAEAVTEVRPRTWRARNLKIFRSRRTRETCRARFALSRGVRRVEAALAWHTDTVLDHLCIGAENASLVHIEDAHTSRARNAEG